MIEPIGVEDIAADKAKAVDFIEEIIGDGIDDFAIPSHQPSLGQ